MEDINKTIQEPIGITEIYIEYPGQTGLVKAVLATNKLDKVTGKTALDQVYIKNKDGQQQVFNVAKLNGDYIDAGIPRYGSDGVLPVGSPKNDTHATPKKYVDDKFNGANENTDKNIINLRNDLKIYCDTEIYNVEERAKNYIDEVKNDILGEGISETFDTLKEIQDWIEGPGVNATELTTAIVEESNLRETKDLELANSINELERAVSSKLDISTMDQSFFNSLY